MSLTKILGYQRRILDWVVRTNPNLGLDRRAESFVQLFENHLEQESRVLDVGGGWGFYHKPLSQRGHHLTVLDVVKPGYQKAPVTLYDGKSEFPFPDKSFDVSMMITVLHHIEDPEPVLHEVLRVTRKKVIVVEDVYHHPLGRLWTQWRDQLYNFEFFGHPCQFRKAQEWTHFFEGYGLKQVDQKNVYTWLSGLRILNGVFVYEVAC